MKNTEESMVWLLESQPRKQICPVARLAVIGEKVAEKAATDATWSMMWHEKKLFHPGISIVFCIVAVTLLWRGRSDIFPY